MSYTIIFILLFIFVLFVKTNEYDDNDENKLKINYYQLTTTEKNFHINNTLLKNSLFLPKPLKLSHDAYKLEIIFDLNQTTIINDDKPRKLQHIQLIYPNITNSINTALENAAKKGIAEMNILYDKLEPDIIKKEQFLDENHPGTFLSKFSAPNEITKNDEKAAYATLIATKYFQKSYKLRATEFGRQSSDTEVTFRRTSLEGFCPPREPPLCLPAALRYRTHDGTCNNIRRPRWGSAHMPFNRFLPPDYEDGIDSIRQSIEGGPLSSARFVSLVVHGTKDGDAPVTLMLAQWGQLIDHDLTSTAQPRSINGSIPRCCGPDDKHPSCFPIKVPFDDPWLAPLKVRCLEFLRSAPAHRRDCSLAWREQTNQATSFLDASPIYSSNARTSDSARIFHNGLLVFGRGNVRDDICLRGAISSQCIRAGDPRSAEQPGLLALHHVWVGEHNRIAQELSDLNLHWSDEKIYQETRRIIGALFQHITYREFLPLVLGKEVCRLFDLEIKNLGYYTKYDSNVNPTVANSFAAAAFRFGHSLVQSSYLRCDRNHNFIRNNVSLHEEFSRGDLGNIESLHRLLRGMASQKSQTRDEFITAELTNHLFQSGDFPFGLDLAAINIQRGRDHGIPRYTSWREPCGLSRIDRWEDLEIIIGPVSTARLSHAYQSVHDIDLFVGGISERPVIGGLVGPTFACIIAQQFSNLRKGDRFWYENFGFENSFTPAQLNSIRRVNFAQVLCRAIDGGTLQPHIFIPHDVPGNERIPCGVGLLAPIDLLPWKERDPFFEKDFSDLDAQESSGFHHQPIRTQNITLVNHVDFVPHGSTGIQIMSHTGQNITKINDKLDFKQKGKPHKIHQNINNKLTSAQNQLLTEQKENQILTIPSSTLSSVLVFNNIPITISPIPFDESHSKIRSKFQSRKSNGKPNRQLDGNVTLLTNTNTSDGKIKFSIFDKTKGLKTDITDDILNLLTVETQTTTTDNTENTIDDIYNGHDNLLKTGHNFETSTLVIIGDQSNQEQQMTHNMNLEKTTLENDIPDIETSISNKTDRIKRDTIDTLNTSDLKDVKHFDIGNFTSSTNQKNEKNLLTNNLTTILPNDINSELNPELRSYTNYLNDINTNLPTSTATHMTYMQTNSNVLHELDGKLEFLDETKLTKFKNPSFVKNNLRDSNPEKIVEEQEEITLNNVPFMIKRNIQKKSDTHLLDVLKRIFTNNANRGTLLVSSHPNALFNLTYLNSTEKLELRRHNQPIIYGTKKQPQKIVLESPESEEYEIEINIRPLGNKRPTKPINPINVYSNDKQYENLYDNDFSSSTFNYRKSTRPSSSFNENSNFYTQKTKPPTIIYVDEKEDRNQYYNKISNNQQSNIFQSLIKLDASNSPFDQYYSIPSKNYATSSSSSSSSSSNGGFGAASASSSSSASFFGGSATASATASSSGNFGSISGSTTNSNADGSPIFNVRIRPSSSTNTYSYPFSTSSTPNEFPEPNKPIYFDNTYTSSPYSQRYSSSNYNNKPSAFSNNRLDEQYSNFQLLNTRTVESKLNSYKKPHNDKYGESRSTKPKDNINITETLQAQNTNLKDIQIDHSDITDTVQFDKDGYLRPEFMTFDKEKREDTFNNEKLINTKINDDYVLHILHRNTTNVNFQNSKVTETQFSDAIPRKPHFEIVAETENTLTTVTNENKQTDQKKYGASIAFAPLKVLTRPERPDNWIIFNTSDTNSLPPEQPELKSDILSSKEFPKPMTTTAIGILKPILKSSRPGNSTSIS